MNVEQAVQLFFELEGAEGEVEPVSELDSEDSDNEVDDPSFLLGEEREIEQPPMCAQSAGRRSAQRQVRSGTPTRSRSPLTVAAEPRPRSEPWKTGEDPDADPAVSRFQPRRTPGVQVERISPQSPKDLFLLFFATDTVRTICSNTNKNAAKSKELGRKYCWTDIVMEDLFGLLIYMSLVTAKSSRLLETKSHFVCAFSSRSDDKREVPYPLHILEYPPQ